MPGIDDTSSVAPRDFRPQRRLLPQYSTKTRFPLMKAAKILDAQLDHTSTDEKRRYLLTLALFSHNTDAATRHEPEVTF